MRRECGYASGSACLRFAPTCKRLRRRALEQLVGIADGEGIAAADIVELFPRDRRGHRRAFAGARRIRHDRGRAALVAQPVEEDAALALHLADVGGEALGLGLGNGAREALGEALDLVPVGADASSGATTCMPLPPVSSGKVFRPRSLEQLAQADRALRAPRAKSRPTSGSRSNTSRSGYSTLATAAAPAVEFDRPHLHAGEQPADVVEVEIVLDVAVLLLDRDVLHVLAERAAVVLLEEAFLARAPAGSGSGSSADWRASTMISGSTAA